MPSKAAAGSPKGKANAPTRPAAGKSAAKSSAAKAKASGKSASAAASPTPTPTSTSAKAKAGPSGPKAAVKSKKAPAKAAVKPTQAKPAAKTLAPTKATAPAKAALAKVAPTPTKAAPTGRAVSAPAAAGGPPAKTSPAKDAISMVKKKNYDKDSLGTIRKRLMEQREELQNQLTAIEESATGLSQSEMSGEVSYDEDFADAGSFTFEREKEFSIANNVTDLRSKTDRALHRIEEGRYGICESCGQPIESARLKALPHVTLCLKCKKAEERR